MRIKVWASSDVDFPTYGPYKLLDVIEKNTLHAIGDMTHYGEVILIPPTMPPFSDEADQSVIVKLISTSLNTRPDNSLLPKPPSIYNKIEFLPIHADTHGYMSDDPPLTGSHTILADENLTIENVSHLITTDTFSLWTKDCYVSRDTASALQNIDYAIVHRYSSLTDRDAKLDGHSTELVNTAFACLALIRPTRRSRAMNIPGIIKPDGKFEPHGFSAMHDPADVPEIQKLFTIRKKDIDVLTAVLPEFIKLYEKDDKGQLKDEYEPLRMAIQLYGEAYAISYWKARHILWWSAIEALYGNSEDAAMARIYALFGNKKMIDGYHRSIYDDEDIPSCYSPTGDCHHTLGKMVPLIYDVRNASAHGQKVSALHFVPVPHPFGPNVVGLDALAEAATFIIRKTVIAILQQGFRDRFKNRDVREDFWLYEYGLDKKQSKKKLRDLMGHLGPP
jgi:hypothetical protein